MPDRFVVTLSRSEGADGGTEVVVMGPYRSRRRADRRAATVRRLAERYDEPEAALDVIVEPLLPGTASAQDAMDVLYGALKFGAQSEPAQRQERDSA